ncbi:MAG TPA: hypothetical protein VIU10_08015, partial [Candidatus Udaeobacter sp.]
MVASSEQHNAPVMVSKPAIAHASSSQPGAPLSRDDSAEVIKMPGYSIFLSKEKKSGLSRSISLPSCSERFDKIFF